MDFLLYSPACQSAEVILGKRGQLPVGSGRGSHVPHPLWDRAYASSITISFHKRLLIYQKASSLGIHTATFTDVKNRQQARVNSEQLAGDAVSREARRVEAPVGGPSGRGKGLCLVGAPLLSIFLYTTK